MSLPIAALDASKAAFAIFEPPYCSGTVPLDETTSKLFYLAGDKSDVVNFADNNDARLLSLAQACQRASFCKNKEEVMDEAYHKGGKMDPSRFATLFSPLTSGIIGTVRENLLRRHADRAIRIELCALNVYGSGEFFKAHVDAPRSDCMFGSLVVVLPTTHQGGSLVFRHQGKEQAFDTANIVSAQPKPHAAFVAFFSDVEHEVAVVTSGYRVTLTYNLYFGDHPSPSLLTVSPSDEGSLQIKSALTALLADRAFLPEGGFIGFGLSHKYPINPETTKLRILQRCLKGSDALLLSICTDLSLNPCLRTLYKPSGSNNNVYLLLSMITNSELIQSELKENVLHCIRYQYGGLYVYDYADGCLKVEDIDLMDDAEELKNATPIVWVKPLTDVNTFSTPFIAYFCGTPGLDYTYGMVCLIAAIGPPEDRRRPRVPSDVFTPLFSHYY